MKEKERVGNLKTVLKAKKKRWLKFTKKKYNFYKISSNYYKKYLLNLLKGISNEDCERIVEILRKF